MKNYPAKSLIFRYFACLVLLAGLSATGESAFGARDEVSYQEYYNPEKGFKPAQTDLSAVFLQLAVSLEHHGSPEPYLRHILAEHARIEAKYGAKYGKKLTSLRPGNIDSDYVDSMMKNWNKLAPKLGLEKLAKSTGRTMRGAILGSNEKGTVVIEILNLHQDLVFGAMAKKGRSEAGFDSLESELLKLLKAGKALSPEYLAKRENLSPGEQTAYVSLLTKDRFGKSDMVDLERFYAAGYDNLTEEGKAQLSRRVWAGQRSTGDEQVKRQRIEAEAGAREFKKGFSNLYDWLGANTSDKVATDVTEWLNAMIRDLGLVAHSELEIGIAEWAIDGRR